MWLLWLQDGSGFLDKDEVHELCKQLGGGIKKRHLQEIMRQIKPDNTPSPLGEDGKGERAEDGVSFEMFRGWWEDRNRKLNDLLVLPEGMIFSIREDAKARKLLPSANGAEAMWHRLAVLLRLLADRQTIWGDPRLLYGQMEQRKEEVRFRSVFAQFSWRLYSVSASFGVIFAGKRL